MHTLFHASLCFCALVTLLQEVVEWFASLRSTLDVYEQETTVEICRASTHYSFKYFAMQIQDHQHQAVLLTFNEHYLCSGTDYPVSFEGG